MGWIAIALIATYLVVGNVLSAQAQRFLREPERGRWISPLFKPEEFRPEGERFRSRAVGFYRIGGLILLVSLVLLSQF